MSVEKLRVLIDRGIVMERDFYFAQREAIVCGTDLQTMLIQLKFATNDDISNALAYDGDVKTIDISALKINPDVLKIVEKHKAEELLMLPIDIDGNNLRVAVEDADHWRASDWVERNTNYDFTPYLATGMRVIDGISKYYSSATTLEEFASTINFNPVGEKEEDELKDAIIQLVDIIILEAVRLGGTDVHIEPDFNVLRIRYRLDGVLQNHVPLPLAAADRVITRIKQESGMRAEERRKPQDGGFNIPYGSNKIDLRVSALPSSEGESIVIRILNPENTSGSMEALGMPLDLEEKFREVINAKEGIVLVTGPTGSGKTTTLYTAINSLDCVEKAIFTLEDPVEYRFPLIRQVQVDEKQGMTFAKGLKALLRQDPDVILVGEIRDLETASLAVKAANTGHLVLSTLHTNSAAATFGRLVDIGIKEFLLAQSIGGIVAQRLLRRVCPKCAETVDMSKEDILEHVTLEFYEENLEGLMDPSTEKITFTEGRGCDFCGGTGNKGRIGVFEVMTFNVEFEKFASKPRERNELEAFARENTGFKSMKEEAIEKALQGVVSLEQVATLSD